MRPRGLGAFARAAGNDWNPPILVSFHRFGSFIISLLGASSPTRPATLSVGSFKNDRIAATPEALELLATLKAEYGPNLLFVQSSGCCDHSSMYCYKESEYAVSPNDVLVGTVGGLPYYPDASQHELFTRTQIVIGVVKSNRSGDMSLEGTEGVIFRMNSQLIPATECALA